MYVNKHYKAGFICHPRTASSATGHMLRRVGFDKYGNHHAVAMRWLLPGWSIACTVRNPLDTLVSWFFYDRHHQHADNFELWLADFEINGNMWTKNGLFYGLQYANYVLRFEHLQEDWDNWLKLIGYRQRVVIPKRNVSKRREGRPWHEFYAGIKIPSVKICVPAGPNDEEYRF